MLMINSATRLVVKILFGICLLMGDLILNF